MIREFPWVPWEFHENGKHGIHGNGNEIGNGGQEMGIVVGKKFPLVALIGWLAEQFAISP